jgi:hypothetical protein
LDFSYLNKSEYICSKTFIGFMKNKFLIFFMLFSILSVFTSCDLFDREEYIPAYINVESVSVSVGPEDGSAAHNISDAWVYVNTDLIGIFEIPFTIPVLESGEHTVTIYPGIKNNGVDAKRVVYHFLYDYSIDTVLVEEEMLRLNPVFAYKPDVVKLNEDFEGIGTIFETSDASDTIIMMVDGDKAFEGRSMAFYLDDERRNFECKSTDMYEIPRNSPVYLEIQHKNTDPFVFGLFIKEFSGVDFYEKRIPVFTFNPTPDGEFRKTHIELNYHLDQSVDFSDYRLFFTCIRTDNSEGSVTEVIIDNIKLLHH